MTSSKLQSVAELQAFVRQHARIHVIGNGSKTALHPPALDAALADLSSLSGIIDYQPSEYTITVRAGTSIKELQTALQQEGQYLPFDPLLPESATIGGTVAANLAGSRRLRYGGVRDFILGASVVDGLGRAFRVGSKVVKNSAGFDLSKFLVGSLGQYAIMTELTFKVFPDVPHFRSLRFVYQRLEELLNAIYFINQSVYELDALDFKPIDTDRLDGGWVLLARLAGFAETLPQRSERFQASMKQESTPLEAQEINDTTALWNPLAELRRGVLAKVVLSPKQIPNFDALIPNLQRRYSSGGNLAWVATDDSDVLDMALKQQGLSGLCLRGVVDAALIGKPIDNVLAKRVKQVLDPQNKLV